MKPLIIRLLGSPEVRVGQRPLTFPTRKVLALLVYLVVEGGRPARETLMALLWPETPPEKAAVTLRGTLSRLRKALRPAGTYLLSEANTVAFDFEQAHDLDLAWLARASRAQISASELTAILTLDRGEFLAGFSLPDAPAFDNWAATVREASQRQVETVYDRLSQEQLARRESAAAVATAARWVARAPLSEQAYRRLMAAQALNGQRPAALQTYQQLQCTLQREMGLEPSRESAVLADNIGRGHVPEEREALPKVVRLSAVNPAGRHLSLPLAGRVEEHGRLVAALRQVGQDGAQVVTLIGAAGVGKTRLISAFLEWAMLDSADVERWQGRAFETGGRLAYQPVLEALRHRLEQVNAPEDLLEDVWLAELSQLMPELRARYPDLPPPMTGDANLVRTRLFAAIAALGSALAEGRTAVFVLDDMQWADADTLELVHYLARRWTEQGTPILLLAVVRQEAYAADAVLREWLTRLERDTTLTRLLLDSLNGAAVQQLVRGLSGEQAVEKDTAAFAAWLWAETRGLPFFIEALLQMLVEQGILTVTDEVRPVYDFASALNRIQSAAKVPMPPGVREVIRTRLAQLSKEAGALLLAAAVLGRACTFERLCQVANLAEAEAMEAVETLLAARLLAERPSSRRPYTVAHDYIREVAYTESSEVRRRVFHRRALLALEEAGAPPAECAFHALAALLDEPAFRFSVAAGGEALASYAVQEALTHFATAREVVQRMRARGEDLSTDLLDRLYKQRGQALELIQHDAEAQANYEEMRVEAIRRQNRAMELAALITQSSLHGSYTGVFDPPKGRELAQEALALARELGDKAAEASALWGLMVIEFFSAGDSRLVMSYGQRALALARELGQKDIVGRTLNVLCWPFVAQMRLQQALEVLTEAKAIWRELRDPFRLGEVSRFMIIIYYIAGDNRRLLVEAPELVELGTAIGNPQDEAFGLLFMALVLARQGCFGQTLDCLEQVRTLSAAIGIPNIEHSHQWGRIALYLAVGALEEAERWSDRLYAQRQAIMPNFIEFLLMHVAQVKIARGKLDEGQAILDEIAAMLPEDAPESHIITSIAVAYRHLHLAQGKPDAQVAGLERRVRPYREAGFSSLLADEHWLRGRAALTLGQLDEAREALLKARTVAEAQKERTILWQVLATLSELEQACGDADAAAAWSAEARLVVEDIAAHAGELRDAFLGQEAVKQLLSAS